MEYLLDVNILVALFWPHHEKHEVAREWFARLEHSRDTWSSCAMTQAGCVRVLANPVVSQGRLTVQRATAILKESLRHDKHRFWSMDLDWPEAMGCVSAEAESYRQVTDLYLIGLAVKQKGRLVTFDRALGKISKNVLVI